MPCIRWTENRVVYYKLLIPGEPITSCRFRAKWNHLSQLINCKWIKSKARQEEEILHHDNTPLQAARMVKTYFETLNDDLYPFCHNPSRSFFGLSPILFRGTGLGVSSAFNILKTERIWSIFGSPRNISVDFDKGVRHSAEDGTISSLTIDNNLKDRGLELFLHYRIKLPQNRPN